MDVRNEYADSRSCNEVCRVARARGATPRLPDRRRLEDQRRAAQRPIPQVAVAGHSTTVFTLNYCIALAGIFPSRD